MKFGFNSMAAASAAALLLVGCSGPADESQALSAAKVSIEAGNSPAATVQLKAVLQGNPSQAEARFLLGRVLLDGGDAAAAAVELRKALELKHPDHAALPALARAMLMRGEYRKLVDDHSSTTFDDPQATADLKTSIAQAWSALGDSAQVDTAMAAALKAVPDYPEAVLLSARLQAGKRDFIGALAQVDNVVKSRPGFGPAWELKGDLEHLGLGRTDAAMESYRKAVDSPKGSVSARSRIIDILLARRDLKGAQQQFQDMKKALPGRPETRFYEAQFAFIEKNHRAARDILQKLVRFAPENVRVLYLAGANELQLGALAQAEAYLNKALQLAPNQASTRTLLAGVQLRAGHPAKALEVLNPLLKGNPPDVQTLLLAAEANLYAGNPQKADELFSRAAKIDSDDPEVRTAVALSRLRRGDREAAVTELASISASDKGTSADMALISTLLRRNRLDAALEAIKVLNRKQPERANIENLTGQILVLKRNVAAARERFVRALSIDPAFFPAAANLANLDVLENKPDQARQRYETVLKADPNNMLALLALSEFRAKTGATTEQVTELLLSAKNAAPLATLPRIRLVEQYIQLKSFERALAAAQEAVTAIPDSAELLELLGRTQALSGDVNQALLTFTKLSTRYPSAVANIRLAEVHRQRKEDAAAMRDLGRALEMEPDRVAAQAMLVEMAVEARNSESGLAIARALQKRMPGSAVGFGLEGDIEAARKKWQAAATAFKAGVNKQDAGSMPARLHAALKAAGNGAEAAAFAEKWIKDHPKDSAFPYYLGDDALSRSDYAVAERRYRESLAIVPENVWAMNNIAWLLVKQNKPGALAMATRANELQPEQPELLDTWAFALAADGQTDRAIEVQKRAVARMPDAGTYRYSLAALYLKAGRKDLAKAEMKTLSVNDPAMTRQPDVAALLKAVSAD